MSKKIPSLAISILMISNLFGQAPIDVAESTLKVGGLGEEVFYYGFAEGDELIFNFQEINGKELKGIEITELPSTSKFMDYKTTKVVNKSINVTRTGIYQFRFSNSALSGRICKFKIQRIPLSDETKNFNTSVYWKTVHDTAYTTAQERYLIKKEFNPVSIVPTTEYFINSGSNATFGTGKSRITFPITLPKNTQEWYYVFSASREKADIDKAKSSFNLMGQLTALVGQTGALNFGVDMLMKPPGGNICDIYLLDYENSRLFESKVEYRYFTSGTRENIKSGVVKMTGGAEQTHFIGIKNPDSMYGIQVVVEVVAIILDEEWGVRDIQKMNVASRQVPYLKN